MTRAEERLYVSGFYRKNEPSALCWGAMIEATRGDAFVEMPAFWGEDETIWRYQAPGEDGPFADAATASPRTEAPLPAWLLTCAPAEASPAPPLRPSSALAAGEPEMPPPSAERHAALARGRLVHTLLQYLPDVEAARRRSAAEVFLRARAPDFDDEARSALIGQVLGVLDMPALAALFGSSVRAEVGLAGTAPLPNGKTQEILGQIDRVAESEAEVIVADYKTGTPVAADATPENYLTQMALYRAVLAPLWPHKNLRMLLIWTEGPTIVELSALQLDEALAGIA